MESVEPEVQASDVVEGEEGQDTTAERGESGNPRRGFPDRGAPERGTGNANERIEITSGSVALIDQFLLSRPVESRPAAMRLSLENGSYGVFRDPMIGYMVIHPMHHELGTLQGDDAAPVAEEILESVTEPKRVGQLRVETRALVFLDAAKLDSEIGREYSRIFRGGDHKGARDYLRQNGGAVRYGFDRTSDVLEVFSFPEKNLVVLRRAHPQ